MKIAVLADIGQPAYHVGDEAMGHAAADELRRRGLGELVLLSRDPQRTRELFGTESARTFEFPWPPALREAYLEEVTRALEGDTAALPQHDQAWEIFRTIESCDAVLIAGGGNLNSTYGWLLYERAAVARIARHFGKPLVVSGQTLGPTLTARDAEVLGGLLRSAQLVGVREAGSHAVARGLGVEPGLLAAGLDDASFLAGEDGEHPRADGGKGQNPEPSGREPYIAATFAPGTGELRDDEFFRLVAEALDDLAEHSGLRILFVPHMGHEGQQDIDVDVHGRIIAAMRSDRVENLEVPSAREAAGITAAARMVVTSRYHPVVFAADGSVPVVGLAVDHYSDVRIGGAMRNWGIEGLTLPLPSLASGGFRLAVREAWQRREEISAYLRRIRQGRRAEAAAWWDAVVRVLEGGEVPAVPDLDQAPALVFDAGWAAEAAAVRPLLAALARRAAVAELELERERDLRRGAEDRLARLDTELEGLRSSRAFRAANAAWRVTGRIKR